VLLLDSESFAAGSFTEVADGTKLVALKLNAGCLESSFFSSFSITFSAEVTFTSAGMMTPEGTKLAAATLKLDSGNSAFFFFLLFFFFFFFGACASPVYAIGASFDTDCTALGSSPVF
jgi:hypothetical protein